MKTKTTAMNVCQCGCGLPAGEGRSYVDASHKQRAYRQRKKHSSFAMARFAGDLIWRQLPEDKAQTVSELLECLKTPQARSNVGAAIYLIMTELNRTHGTNHA